MVDYKGVFLENEGTNRHVLIGLKLYTIFINVSMNSSLDTTCIRFKVDNNFYGIGISQQESILTLKEKGRVYGKGKGTGIFIGKGDQ